MLADLSILYAEKVEIKEPTKLAGLDTYVRKLLITTNKGEEIQIGLFAKSPEALEVLEVEGASKVLDNSAD
jgi:hypothetical protein